MKNEETAKIGRQYQTTLSFRFKEVLFPNNRRLVESRLVGIISRMIRDKQFPMHCKGFLEELFLEGYTRQSSKLSNDGKVWYLPHLGIYHLGKPNKIRVVFDCNAEYKGRCLDKELLPVPDLANQLIRVLLGFRKETLAFMAYIEKMFLQVCVSEKHRNFLRFLWQTDNAFTKNHEMCAYIF